MVYKEIETANISNPLETKFNTAWIWEAGRILMLTRKTTLEARSWDIRRVRW
jgi:hypothetical protein